MTTTIKHIKDNAEYVTLVSQTNIKNVQQMFDSLGTWAYTSPGLPVATDTVQGIRRLATQQEVNDGLTDNIVTPKTLAVRLQYPAATEDVQGIARFTKNTEALGFANTTAVTPKTVKYIFDNYAGTEARFGSAKVASKAQAIAGVLDTVVITPKKLKDAIDAIPDAPVIGPATESYMGVVNLATTAQARAGTLREGFAISPYTFDKLTGNETQNGVFKVAKQTDMAGTSDSLVITPKKLNAVVVSDTTRGIVKLTTDVNNTDTNTALKPSSNLVTKAGGVFTGDIYKTNTSANNKYLTSSEVDSKITLTKNQLTTLINDTVNSSVSQAMNTRVLGINQSWVNVNGSRRSGATYLNNTGRPIMVFAGGDLATYEHSFVIDGVVTRYRDWNAGSFLSFIVPHGSSYAINGTFYAGSTFWLELR